MTIMIRKSQDRGHANHGWLDSHHTFSFANYHDPAHMGFHTLRVINEDRVKPGQGFPRHPHRDMEIISYVLDGALEHRDSMGNGSVIRPGDVQLMSAGRGVLHSEYNASDKAPVHFLQIWIVPDERGGDPGYQQQHFSNESLSNQWCEVVGGNAPLSIKQNARLAVTRLDEKRSLPISTAAGRASWIHVARGNVTVGAQNLAAGDAMAIDSAATEKLVAQENSEILWFDLAAR